MAFTLAAIVGSTTVTLTNGTPFALLSATGMGGASVRRVTAQGPAQHGDTDLGYRLAPREIELEIGFSATTDTILDGYRDTLTSIFKPLTSTPVKLRATRDDGGIRQIDCYVVGSLKIDLVPEYRPGHYHRATVRLRAADPAWYNPTPGTVIGTASSGTAADWYLAGGAIGTASVLMHGGTPAQGEVWSYAGSIPTTSSWTLAFRTTRETNGTADKYAFYVKNSFPAMDITLRSGGTAGGTTTAGYYASTAYPDTSYSLPDNFVQTGTSNYYVRHDPNGVNTNNYSTDPGLASPAYQDAYSSHGTDSGINYDILLYDPGVSRPIGGTARRWRSDATNTASSRWGGSIYLYALYSPGLSQAQINTLDNYMAGAIGGTAYISTFIPYDGDLPEYPIISVRGPINNFRMINVSSGNIIDFGTTVIAAGETYVLDTRPGYKTVTLGTVNKRSALASYSDWDGWNITPDQSAEGVNPIIIYGTNTSGSTQVSIVYYNRYSGI